MSKNRKLTLTQCAAAVILLAASPLFGDTVDVDFNAALTNETEWVFSDKIKFSQSGEEHHYFDTINSYIKSPQFHFNVTSVTIRLSCSSTNATRHLLIGPTSDSGQLTANVAKKDTKESQTFLFDASSNMRSFLISLKGMKTTGSWHVYSATISGEALVSPPSGAQAPDVSGTRFALAWTNPANAVSNRISVAQVKSFAERGDILDSYDFMTLTNTSQNAKDYRVYDKSTLRMTDYPAFSGTNIYAAGHSTGVVQISSSDYQGYLRYDFTEIRNALDEAANVSMLVSAKRHSSDTTGKWNLEAVQFDGDDTGSRTNNIVLGFEFPPSPYVIDIKDPLSCKSVALRPSGTENGNRRILIDTIAFVRDYAPAHVETNIVQTAVVPANGPDARTTVRRLTPNADYLVTVTAFDEEGNESAPSEPLAVSTNGKDIPFSMHIQ